MKNLAAGVQKGAFSLVEGVSLFPFSRLISGKRKGLTPQRAELYEVSKEPWGMYASEKRKEHHWLANASVQYGVIKSKRPLMIADREGRTGLSWKGALTQQFGGLTGKDLSAAILEEGFDLVVAYDRQGVTEVCALNELAVFRYNPFQVYAKAPREDGDTFFAVKTKQDASKEKFENLLFVNPGKVFPVGKNDWEIGGQRIEKVAREYKFDSIAVIDTSLSISRWQDQIAPYEIVPVATLQTFALGGSIEREMGYNSGLGPTNGFAINGESVDGTRCSSKVALKYSL